MSDSSTSASIPSDAAIRKRLDKLVRKVDVKTMKFKAFMKLLEQKMKVPSLREKKKFIRKTITEILDSMDDSEDDDAESLEETDSRAEQDMKKKKKKKKKKRPKSTGSEKGSPSEGQKANPFNTPKELSVALATFLGQGNHMSRPQVVKAMWEHIREHDLQNPENKREILLDEPMQKVFGVERFTMFKMAKYLSAHIYPFKPVNLEEDAEETAAKKRKREAKMKAKKKQKTPTKKKFPLYRLSEIMSDIVGEEIATRPTVTKAITAYIKKNDLQNPEDRRQIMCDKRLRRLLDDNSMVTFFTMQKYISPHLVERVGIENDSDEENTGHIMEENEVVTEEVVEEDDSSNNSFD